MIQIDHDLGKNQTKIEGDNDKETVELYGKDYYSHKNPKTIKITRDFIPTQMRNKRKYNLQNKVTKKMKMVPITTFNSPTIDEIKELKDTRNLFHSNLFRLQVVEMLTEVKVKDKYKTYLNLWLERLKMFVNNLENYTENNYGETPWLQNSGLHIPLAWESLNINQPNNFEFKFFKPTIEPYIIGSAAIQTLLGPKFIADICVQMPSECFHKDNYLNLIYDKKRAYYLTYLAIQLVKSDYFTGLTENHLKFNYYSNNPLKPVLEISPHEINKSIEKNIIIRLFVSAEESLFKLNRFVPWNSNIRSHKLGIEKSVPLATPNYNAGVLFDLTMKRNQEYLNEIFNNNKNCQEGLILLKVWLQQRQLHIGFSSFNNHMLAMLIAYVFQHGKIHLNMSCYQVARIVWTNLAQSSWDECNKGITLCKYNPKEGNIPTLEQFHVYYDVVFIDVTGYYNICANLSVEIYHRIRSEAKSALDMLNNMKLNSFQTIFMKKIPLYSQFDNILKINKTKVIDHIINMHMSASDKLNFYGYKYPQLLKVITGLLRTGLGKRIKILLPLQQHTISWSCKSAPPKCANYLNLGILLDSSYAYEIFDKGPESIAEKADEFRKFWGDKSKLRRFQDGTITESVVWAKTDDTIMRKRLIVRSIVLHLLQHHFQIDSNDIEYIAGDFEIVYKLSNAFKVEKLKFRVPQEIDADIMSLHVIRSFDDLTRKIHGINDLPLEIVSICGISSVFHYCDPTPILPLARVTNNNFYAPQVLYGVIQLSLTGKWPNELNGIRALKCAFYIRIAKLLREKHQNIHTKVSCKGLFIIHNGYCFSIEIAHPKEIAILKREKSDCIQKKYIDIEKRYYILPKVSGALHALYQGNPCFGTTVMIAKRWLYSQLIDDGLWPNECTELLIASLFLNIVNSQVISSSQTGFIRFLQLLAYTEWNTELIFINFNQSMNENALTDLEHCFHSERDKFPPLCVATAFDESHYGQLWTTHLQPNVNVLSRVVNLASQALEIIERTLLSSMKFIKPANIFLPSTDGYDLIIQLKSEMITNTFSYEFGSSFVEFSKPNWRLPLAGTNFLKSAIERLRKSFSEYAAFFYNPCGGKEIAVKWKPPHVFLAKEFKVTEVNGCSMNSNITKKIQCRKETLIEDFKFILKDYYVRIESLKAEYNSSQIELVKTEKKIRRYHYNSKNKEKNIKML